MCSLCATNNSEYDEAALIRRLDSNIAGFMAKRDRVLKPRRRAWGKVTVIIVPVANSYTCID
jgi:hypothetical protein